MRWSAPQVVYANELFRRLVLHGEALHVHLMVVAEREGLDIASGGFAIHVDGLGGIFRQVLQGV